MSTQASKQNQQILNHRYRPARIAAALATAALALAALSTAAAGCLAVDGADSEQSSATAADTAGAAVYPDRMWANSSYLSTFVGVGPAVVGYTEVAFDYTNASGHHAFTLPIGSNGGFVKYFGPGESPSNGNVIRATWSGPELAAVQCDFAFRYYGGAVYSFAEMGCVAAPVQPPPTGTVFPERMWSNASYFASHVGVGPAVVDYSQVAIQYDYWGTPVVLTAPIYNGGFSLYTQQSPANGTPIFAKFSGPGLQSVGCRFWMRYSGGAVYSFAEMGCGVVPVPD